MSTIETAEQYAEVFNEIIALGRSDPDHRFDLDAGFLSDFAEAVYRSGYQAGYVKGLAEPVAVKVKDVVRDDVGNMTRVVEYQALAPRPAE